MALNILVCKDFMVNVENSPERTFTIFPKHVTFSPRYRQSVLGNTLNCRGILLLAEGFGALIE